MISVVSLPALRACAAILGLLAAAISSSAVASTIQFDPDGAAGANGVLNISTIDFQPGNTLVTGVGSLLSNTTINQPVTVYAQTRIGSLLDSNGNTVPVAGLNTSFELTMVLGFSALASIDNSISPTHPLPTTTLSLDPSATVNFCSLYYDNTVDADDLAGTGFNDGTLILNGAFSTAGGGFFRFADTPLFDNFGADNYAGLTTRHVVGGGDYRVGVGLADPNFFTSGLSQVMIELLNDSTVTPFGQANPSQRFFDGLGPNIIPNLGGMNGNGPDFQSQNDANASFTPEPSSVLLALVGSVGLLAGLQRRKAR